MLYKSCGLSGKTSWRSRLAFVHPFINRWWCFFDAASFVDGWFVVQFLPKVRYSVPAHSVGSREEPCKTNGGDRRDHFQLNCLRSCRQHQRAQHGWAGATTMFAGCLPEVVVVIALVVRVVVLGPIARRWVLRPAPLHHSAIVLLSLRIFVISSILLKRKRGLSVVGGVAGHLAQCCGQDGVWRRTDECVHGGGNGNSKAEERGTERVLKKSPLCIFARSMSSFLHTRQCHLCLGTRCE